MTTGKDPGLEAPWGQDPSGIAAEEDFAVEWNRKPVLTVSMRNKGLPGDDTAQERFADEIRRYGFDPDDVALTNFHSTSAVDFSWPRSVKWKALPIIGDPVYCPGHFSRYLLVEGKDRRGKFRVAPRSDGRLLGRCTDVIVIAVEDLSERDLYEIEAMRRQDRPGGVGLMLHFDGRHLREISPAEVQSAFERHYAHDRFVYNHAVNLVVIGARAYVSISRERGEDQGHVEAWAPQLHSFHWRFGFPMCVQMLCHLGRRTASAPAAWFSHVPQQTEWLWANRSGFFEKTAEGDQFRWPGTGTYSSWTEMISPHVDETKTKIEGTEFTRSYVDEIVFWMSSLNFADFVCLDDDGEVCLSSKGRRYFDIVAPALEDPDVLLRWRTQDGLFCSMKDIPAVDRWLNRAFRKLKRAVGHLPASPINEDGVNPWPKYRRSVLLVRGRKIDVTEEMLSDEAFLAEARRIEEQQARTRPAEWREGVVRQPVGYGLEGRIEHLWFGRPLCICADNYKEIGRYEVLADWRSVDEDVDAREVPGWMNGSDARITTLAFTEALHDPEVFVRPDRLMEENDRTCPIIHGRVLQLEIPLQDEEIAHMLKYQQMGVGIMGRQPDGLRIFGRGQNARFRSISIGVQVGAFDPTEGKAVMETTWCSRRSENVSRSFWSQKKGDSWDCVTGHPELSKEAYWIMLPDGRTIEVPLPSGT